jgi:hypothetical protein
MPAIYDAVGELRTAGVVVISPSDPRVVDHLREFLFVASDRTRLKRQVQQRHLEAISKSDFLWLVCPDGYTGVSAAMEIGWALHARVPVFAERKPADVTVEDFVFVAQSISDAIALVRRDRTACQRPRSTMLLDPDFGAQSVIDATLATQDLLTGTTSLSPEQADREIRRNARIIGDAFKMLEDDQPHREA